MIFVTVGSMMPFDRLIRSMDDLVISEQANETFAQIGAGDYIPTRMDWIRKLSPSDFHRRVRQCSIVVAHAGMGSVITALENSKPIVVLPRSASKLEHTTDHQIDTAKWLKTKMGVFVAATEQELPAAISSAKAASLSGGEWAIPKAAPEMLVNSVRSLLVRWIGAIG